MLGNTYELIIHRFCVLLAINSWTSYTVQYVRGMNARKGKKRQKYISPTLEPSYARLGAS
jgi:hypothetical protein